jgi:tetratricopeptide (TPR) repeat protein
MGTWPGTAFASLVAVSVVVAPSGAAAAPGVAPADAFASGRALAAAGRYGEAAAKLADAVRADPGFAPAWFALGSAERRAGRCDRAMGAYRRYAELVPADAEPHYGLGLCLEAVGDRPGAAAALQRYLALERAPGAERFRAEARKRLAPLLLAEARAARDGGRPLDAVAHYRSAISVGADVDAHCELGDLLLAGGRDEEAATELAACVHLVPKHALGWYDLAFVLRRSGRAAQAVEAYRRYIELRPADPDPFYGLGWALAALGRSDEALKAFRDYVRMAEKARPADAAWIDKARAEVARLEAKRR